MKFLMGGRPLYPFPSHLAGRVLKTVARAHMRTFRAKILADDSVLISHPIKFDATQMKDFLSTLESKLPAQIQVDKRLPAIPPFFSVGHVEVEMRPGFEFKMRLRGNRCRIDYPSQRALDSQEVRAFVDKSLWQIWKVAAQAEFAPRLKEMATSVGLCLKSVTLRPNKSRWGSCTSANDISLSSFLIALPKSLQDYVLWHELCHFTEKHHGATFWRQLESYLPDARRLDRELNAYGIGNYQFVEKDGHWQCMAKPLIGHKNQKVAHENG